MPWLMKSEPDVFSIDDLRRKQCQSQNAADIGLVDLLRGGELGGRCVLAALYQSSPPVTACNRFQHGAVDARPRRSPGSRALGHDYQLAPAALPKASAAVA